MFFYIILPCYLQIALQGVTWRIGLAIVTPFTAVYVDGLTGYVF